MTDQPNDQANTPQNQAHSSSTKQKIELQRGRNVPIDYFLYSCLEYERTRRAMNLDEAQINQGRWPIMVGATLESLPAELMNMELKGLLSRMSLWYAAQYPEMVEETPLDHIMLNNIVEPFMKFTLDLADLVFLKTGTPLPAHNSAEKEVWSTICAVLKEDFPGYWAYFDRFLRWTFADVEPEEIEEGSRPPVGRNMPNFKGNRQSGNPGQNNHRQQGPSSQNHRQGSHGGPSSQRRGHEHKNQNHNRPQRPNQNQQADAEIEKQALGAVDEAIAKITSGDVEEVFLKPVNSFYRRIQHQYAVDKGFESCSVGEGAERGVKVSKKIP